MKYYLIAGEASGDLHGSNLMKGIREADKSADFRYFGGDLMQGQGGVLVKHYREMAFMGVAKVVLNLTTIRRNMDLCKSDILSWKPDAVIFIDFPGFNLRISKFTKKHGFVNFYYISPTVWAWHKSRIHTIKETIRRMFVILPFEVEFYKAHNYQVEYLGNPVLDAVQSKMDERTGQPAWSNDIPDDKPVIALLPGSRKQEIDNCLPEMLSVVPHFPGHRFIIAGAPALELSLYQKYTKGLDVDVVYNQTYDLLQKATAAVVTSGTATLETALFMVPEVVCYKTGHLTYHIGIHLIRFHFFSLVNLIMEKEVVKELLQHNLSHGIREELSRILSDQEYRQTMLDHFAELKKLLGKPGASFRIGKRVVELMNQTVNNQT